MREGGKGGEAERGVLPCSLRGILWAEAIQREPSVSCKQLNALFDHKWPRGFSTWLDFNSAQHRPKNAWTDEFTYSRQCRLTKALRSSSVQDQLVVHLCIRLSQSFSCYAAYAARKKAKANSAGSVVIHTNHTLTDTPTHTTTHRLAYRIVIAELKPAQPSWGHCSIVCSALWLRTNSAGLAWF